MAKPIQARFITQAELDITGFGQACLVIGRKITVASTAKYENQTALLLPGNADHNDRGGVRNGNLFRQENPLRWGDIQGNSNQLEWFKQLSARIIFKGYKLTEPYLFIEGPYPDLIIFCKDLHKPNYLQWVDNLMPQNPKQANQQWLDTQLAKNPSLPVRPKPFDPFEL